PGGTPASRPPASSTTAAPAPAAPPPDLPPVPEAPASGAPGAGTLATRSVPLGENGVAARLTFRGLVLEQRAVGVTATYPAMSVTVTGEAGEAGYAALAHVRLPLWNCLADAAPEDPEAAGCVRAGTEYADLPSPALTVTRQDGTLRITGRFPTYVRPNGSAPVYTGRVYELTVSAAPEERVRNGSAPAEAVLFLGTDRAETVDRRGLNVLRYAG
ncbi:MAG TPA: hypothetical protein VHF92_17720, partial [Geodermatophilus sp.]|nr:hypothetical protein [Geodermatophilus sp.]